MLNAFGPNPFMYQVSRNFGLLLIYDKREGKTEIQAEKET
jgi:hypothetical protein